MAEAPTLLLVVDVQNGFVNEHTRHVIEPINALIKSFADRGAPIAFTRFVNVKGGAHERWIGWTRFMEEPENALHDGIESDGHPVFIKHGYTAFTEEFEGHLEELEIERLVICGIATDGCVLKSAVDAFEREIEPVVATDACASHAGEAVHEAGLLLLGRFIGKKQLKLAVDL
jgi:nicotinamidase-related amidase